MTWHDFDDMPEPEISVQMVALKLRLTDTVRVVEDATNLTIFDGEVLDITDAAAYRLIKKIGIDVSKGKPVIRLTVNQIKKKGGKK